tara:strand:- start:20 stop:466 length:447 start_codon:yes stop_codon:yes gene_type:complete
MANAKFIRLLVGGVPTLINVTDVTTVVAAGAAAAQAATVTISYASGGSTILTTGATAAINFLAAANAVVSQAFWNLIADSITQPWNMPILPANGSSAVLMTAPVSAAVVAPVGPAGSPVPVSVPTFASKQSSPVLNQGGTQLFFLTAV